MIVLEIQTRTEGRRARRILEIRLGRAPLVGVLPHRVADLVSGQWPVRTVLSASVNDRHPRTRRRDRRDQ